MTEEATNLKAYCKIINKFHVERISEYINEKDTQKGWIIHFGGDIDISKCRISPTIIEIKDPWNDNSKLNWNEVFGPILKVSSFSNFNELLDILEERDKPLAAYYFGKVLNNQNKQDLEKYLSCGAFVVNDVCTQSINQFLPFGGVGHSGQGCFRGEVGFWNFTHQKAIMVKPTLNFGDFKKMGVHPFDLD